MESQQVNDDEMDCNQSYKKISKYGFSQRKWQAILNGGAAWLMRIYRGKLKQHYLFHLIAHWIRYSGMPFYIKNVSVYLFNRKEKRWRTLTKLSDYVERKGVATSILVEPTVVQVPESKVFPICDQSCLITTDSRYKFPEVFVASIENAIIYGNSNLILVDGEVVCHDLYDFDRDYTSEETYSCALIDPRDSRIRWLIYDKEPAPIDKAAIFVDACAANYAHWMTEVLPRIVMFCSDERYSDVPIVVDEGLHENIMESLFWVVGASREIIILSKGRALSVGELYLTSVVGYVPFGRRSKKLSGFSHGMFSPLALDMFRKYMNGLGENVDDKVMPDKVVLRRNSGMRKVSNMDELEKLLVERGYVVVETEKLTFLQQVQLFKHAKKVIAPTGAALANAIFCAPGTQVTVFMGKHKDMIYKYWCHMLTPLQIDVSYILGDIVTSHDRGIHGDFVIDADDVLNLLETQVEK